MQTTGKEKDAKHTPTPWANLKAVSGHWAIYDQRGKQLFRFGDGQDETWEEPKNSEGNAAFIVRAVNAHDKLISALKNATDCLALELPGLEGNELVKELRRVIAEAEEGMK